MLIAVGCMTSCMGILSEGREPVQYATPAAATEGSTDFCLRSGTRAGLPAAGAGGAHWPAVRCGADRPGPTLAPHRSTKEMTTCCWFTWPGRPTWGSP